MPIDIEKDDVKTALQKLKARENSFALIEQINNLGSWEVDLQTKKAVWSTNSYKLYEYEPYSIEPTLDVFFQHLLPEYHEKVQETIKKLLTSHKPEILQAKIKTTSGKICDVLLSAQALYDENGQAIKLIGSTQDISEKLKLEQKTQELSSIIENSSNEIYIVDFNTEKYLYVNKGACDALKYTKKELLNLSLYDINKQLTPQIIEALKAQYKSLDKDFISNQTIHTRKDGTTYHVQGYIQKITYNATEAYIIFDTDVTQNLEVTQLVQQQSELLHHQANHDALTNLPNRTLFQDRLSQAISTAKREQSKFALFFIDLDHFKDINDSLGHQVGDAVLKEISGRLSKTIRESDTLARLGGDEFTIILQNISNLNDVSMIANKIIDIIKHPITLGSNKLHITTSVGISIYPTHAKEQTNLIKYADTAMYKAKDKGRNNYLFYSVEMSAETFKRVVMENSLRVAIKEEQFSVYYQPQINIITDKLIGMEALVRWNHPTLGLVSPMDFIPIAEDLGLIVEIDRIVMKQAMAQFYEWNKEKLNPGILSLNLSMKQLNEIDFINYLLKTMSSTSFKKEWLGLEITETQVMKNPLTSIKKLNQIHNYGIQISIDDFGTGYSSLSYLKKFPLSKLKIDKSFIKDIPGDEEDMAITKAIIALAKSLKLGLIAEGVETQKQKEFLLDNGCDCIQGYLYSKPLPADEMSIYLQKF